MQLSHLGPPKMSPNSSREHAHLESEKKIKVDFQVLTKILQRMFKKCS